MPMQSTGQVVVLIVTLLVAALGAAVAPTLAASSDRNEYGIGIRAVVPVVCKASAGVGQVTVQPGQTPIGELSEFCNNASGYQVWADYSQSLAGVTLLVDGKPIRLTPGGSVLINSSPSAAIARKALALEASVGATGTLAIRVVCPDGAC